MGEYEAALVDFDRVISMGKEYSYYRRGLVYEALGETEKAIEDYTRYLEAYPDSEPESDDARERLEALEN